MDEISVQMSMSSEAFYSEAVAALARSGYTATRGRGRMVFPTVLVVRRLESEDDKERAETIIRTVDPAAGQVEPPGVFAN